MLTPEEIFEKEFKRSMRGYDIDEVNEFLDEIIQDYSQLLDENVKLKKENQQLKTTTSRHKLHSTNPQSSKEQNEQILLEDLRKRIEILEKKTKFL